MRDMKKDRVTFRDRHANLIYLGKQLVYMCGLTILGYGLAILVFAI